MANTSQATSQRPLQMAEGIINNNMNITTNSNTSHRSVCSCSCLGTVYFAESLGLLRDYSTVLLLYSNILGNLFGQYSMGAWVWHCNVLLQLSKISNYHAVGKHLLSSSVSYSNATKQNHSSMLPNTRTTDSDQPTLTVLLKSPSCLLLLSLSNKPPNKHSPGNSALLMSVHRLKN